MRSNLWLVVNVLALVVPLNLTAAEPLPGTMPLVGNDDLAEKMLTGIDRFLDRRNDWAAAHRAEHWKRDASSPAKYAESVDVNRKHLSAIVGLIDKRIAFDSPELIGSVDHPALLAHEAGISIYRVRWPAVGGMWGEGLLLTPDGAPKASVVAIPDADQTPEMLCGLTPGVKPSSQFAIRLARSGCRVLAPALVSRDYTHSVSDFGKTMNLSHREWVYRPAFQMGRTIIAYELQKILAAVDWFDRENKKATLPTKIGVIGFGEGGLLALYAGALDTRIDSTCVSGYFDSRKNLWQEPIDRNLQGLLTEFSDAEIGSMIAPRKLVIESGAGPQYDGPTITKDRRNLAAPGTLSPPDAASVRAEFDRLLQFTAGLPAASQPVLSSQTNGYGESLALSAFLQPLNTELGASVAIKSTEPIEDQTRQKRLINQMQEFTQQLVRESSYVRADYWSKADRHNGPEKWAQSLAPYREQFERQVIGIFDGETRLPPNVRTRQIFDEPTYVGYDVEMDVFHDVIASGILLVPKGIKPGEKRPVVVCQHGLDGHPRDVADPAIESRYYHRFACHLAEQGFVTYAPQNPYFGGNRFRQLIRKADPLGGTLWTFIIAQHRQQTDFLASLPFVDDSRIAFYGLSYGGKTAVFVPPIVNRYCLSIASGDFNEWTWKTTSIRFPAGYPSTPEYEIWVWNMGNLVNHSEMAGMVAPRPFMVERGHNDGVGIDEWVGYEYAKVKHLYDDLGIGDRTTIEWFNGPHMINAVGTFEFLHKQLNWPQAK